MADNLIVNGALTVKGGVDVHNVINVNKVNAEKLGLAGLSFNNKQITLTYDSSSDIYDVEAGSDLPIWSYDNFIKLENPNTNINSDRFGCSVAVSGNYVVVGARSNNESGGWSGRVYVYNASGTLLQTITNPNTTTPESDGFGMSVATDGNHIVIGAYTNDQDADFSGRAYIYNMYGTLLYTLSNPNTTSATWDLFGQSVAVSGSYVIVGASDNDQDLTLGGRAYIYNTSGTLLSTLSDPVYALASDGSFNSTSYSGGGRFGKSVATNGTYVVIGAPEDITINYLSGKVAATGRVYVYDTSGTLLQTIIVPFFEDYNSTYDFGCSVAIDSSNNIVIGAPTDSHDGNHVGRAYVYNISGVLQNALLSPDVELTQNFGKSVSICNNYIAVASNLEPENIGVIYIYDKSGNIFSSVKEPSSINSMGEFGSERGMDIDDNTFIVGSQADNDYRGDAFIYPINSTTVEYNEDVDIEGKLIIDTPLFIEKLISQNLQISGILYNSDMILENKNVSILSGGTYLVLEDN